MKKTIAICFSVFIVLLLILTSCNLPTSIESEEEEVTETISTEEPVVEETKEETATEEPTEVTHNITPG